MTGNNVYHNIETVIIETLWDQSPLQATSLLYITMWALRLHTKWHSTASTFDVTKFEFRWKKYGNFRNYVALFIICYSNICMMTVYLPIWGHLTKKCLAYSCENSRILACGKSKIFLNSSRKVMTACQMWCWDVCFKFSFPIWWMKSQRKGFTWS